MGEGIGRKIKIPFGINYRPVEVGDITNIAEKNPLQLELGGQASNIPIAFLTYGKLNAEKTNAIVIFHALTADQYIAESHPVTGKEGWWNFMVGSGKPIDTDKFFVICANVLGGCMGSFSPKTINPKTGKEYAIEFPQVTIQDMVLAQKMLTDKFGIDEFACVIGSSMGGMQAIEWVSHFGEQTRAAIIISSTFKQNSQNIAFHEVARQAIVSDPNWDNGYYPHHKKFPIKGLAVARMSNHVTYTSEKVTSNRFGRQTASEAVLSEDSGEDETFRANFQIENYIRHQGRKFVERFDPNSYLYLTKASNLFDVDKKYNNEPEQGFVGLRTNFLVVSFSTDWLCPTYQSLHITNTLQRAGCNVSFMEIESDKGHDTFLIPRSGMEEVVSSFVKGSVKL